MSSLGAYLPACLRMGSARPRITNKVRGEAGRAGRAYVGA